MTKVDVSYWQQVNPEFLKEVRAHLRQRKKKKRGSRRPPPVMMPDPHLPMWQALIRRRISTEDQARKLLVNANDESEARAKIKRLMFASEYIVSLVPYHLSAGSSS